VTTLRQGQYATVLQLPAAPRRISEVEKQDSCRSVANPVDSFRD
jgi:hypothetical protein